MQRVEANSASKGRGRGILHERLWVLLLPALVVFSVVAATWSGITLRAQLHQRNVAAIEESLKNAIHGSAADVGRAVESGQRERYESLVTILARLTRGRVLLYDKRGGVLFEAWPETVTGPLGEAGALVKSDAEQEMLVWGPAIGAGGSRIGELRIYLRVPPAPAFPWAVWSSLLAAFLLMSAGVLFLVTRVLAPLTKLEDLFRTLGKSGPHAVAVPPDRLAEFGQLRRAVIECLDGLKERQLRTEESFVEVAFGLAREYEYHREGVIGHGQRVRRYASWVADRLRLPPKQRDTLEVASLCHDIGRIPVDGANEDPSQENAMHPRLGATFFDAMPGLEEVGRIIEAHHENYDGSGFPNRLAGEDIPLGARILRIADGFERCYSEEGEVALQDVLDEMEDGKGTLYDPYLFEFFREEVAVHMLERRRLKVTLKAYQIGKAASVPEPETVK